MTMAINKTTYLAIVLCLIVLLTVACAPAPSATAPGPTSAAPTTAAPKPPQTSRLLMGATSITSGYYVVAVALASAINKSGLGFSVTTVETGAGYDNLLRLKRGDLQFATIQAHGTVWEATNGKGKYDGKPDPIFRLLFPLYTNVFLTAVTVDSGVKTISDLNGKGFYYGIVGSLAEQYADGMLKALNIKPNKYVGGLSDAVDAIKDRRIAGTFKASSPFVLDSALKDINVLQPIRLITLTPDEVKKVDAAIAGVPMMTIKAGSYAEVKDQGEIACIGGATCTITTSSMDEETGYKLSKAMAQNWKDVMSSNDAIVKEPLKEFLPLMKLSGKVVAQLHAGTVRYLKEVGVDVPTEFIPPEYKK